MQNCGRGVTVATFIILPAEPKDVPEVNANVETKVDAPKVKGEVKETLKKFLANENFPEDQIAKILDSTNEQNIALAEKLCTDTDFPKSIITDILYVTNKQNIESKFKIYDLLKNDENFPKDQITYILYMTNEQNIALAEKLCTDTDFPKEKIADILSR